MEQFFNFIAKNDDTNIRLDLFLSSEFSEMSRNSIQNLISNGYVIVNEKTVQKNYKLKSGDIISVTIPAPKQLDIQPENIPIDILFEDDDIIVINKPQNMVVHPAPGHYSGTLVNALLYHCGKNLSGINGVLRPGIVHRIDKDTSGVLVIAKNDLAHRIISEQFSEHSITRIYNAIVFNGFKEKEGIIDKPIGRHYTERKKMSVTEKNSKRAITHYTVLKNLGKFTFMEFRLETGRTHQIRVHMAYIGHPLLGDCVYGPQKQPFNLNGQVLHARVLGFIHPITKKYMEFETPLPEYFQKLIKNLEAPPQTPPAF